MKNLYRDIYLFYLLNSKNIFFKYFISFIEQKYREEIWKGKWRKYYNLLGNIV